MDRGRIWCVLSDMKSCINALNADLQRVDAIHDDASLVERELDNILYAGEELQKYVSKIRIEKAKNEKEMDLVQWTDKYLSKEETARVRYFLEEFENACGDILDANNVEWTIDEDHDLHATYYYSSGKDEKRYVCGSFILGKFETGVMVRITISGILGLELEFISSRTLVTKLSWLAKKYAGDAAFEQKKLFSKGE